ncbi:MAG: hypothetical protein LRY76_01340, partial [Alphaproteobacteria bacterium]|nr:hypothetical protein [Alphaproteobacteria bacterium]
MKAIERCLYSRNGHYYFRASLPRSLHPIVGIKEIRLGLATQDLSLARVQTAQLQYEFSRKLRQFQTSLIESPDPFTDTLVDQFLNEVDEFKSAIGYHLPEKLKKLYFNRKRVHKPKFSEVVEKYLADHPTESHGTLFHIENTYSLFQELMGDPVFKDITKTEAREFKTRLMKIPSNAKKTHSIESFEGVDLDSLTGKPQHPKTINNRLAYLIALFNWAIRTDYYHGANPFSNLKMQTKKASGARRHPFKTDELKTLFQSPLCKNSKHPSLLWVPLIGLYSGMRLNEICQLYVQD